MSKDFTDDYNKIRENGETGFYEEKRGLIAVWGKESVQFLNGLITNDVAKLEDGAQMLAAFPNAQGRLLAAVRVKRIGEKFLFETEEATREKVYNNLFRFTFAGDFFVEDLSEKYTFFSVQSAKDEGQNEDVIKFEKAFGTDYFVPVEAVESFKKELEAAVEISDDLYEILQIENGIPLYGKDMDETTIIPELGIDELISYNKGCYIGQEIIARIYFRGHVAKQLRGLVFEDETANVNPQDELKTLEGKNAGKITSVTFSPKLGRKIALGFVRYDYLAEGTELKVGELTAKVKSLPFI
jgi:tRNA-modifying protein YgfZ